MHPFDRELLGRSIDLIIRLFDRGVLNVTTARELAREARSVYGAPDR
jgi:hypothetical protein